MQTLSFEQAWDRTIAPEDRQYIQHLFEKTSFENGVHFTLIREAINHKQETLVTVLIHNCEETPLILNDICIAYQNEVEQMCEFFSLPIQINPFTSMPWTFIFPEEPTMDCEPVYTIQQ